MKKWKMWLSVSLSFLMLIAVGLNNSTCVSIQSVDFKARILPASTVALVQAEKPAAREIDYEEILSMTKEAVRLAGGLGGIIHDGDTVVLKPNLVTVNDYTLPGWQGRPLSPEVNGTTTDWRLTKAVTSIVRELNPGGKVYVMEGSAIPTRTAFSHHKYTHENIPGVDLFIAIEEDTIGSELIQVDVPGGLYMQQYAMNRKYKEADVVISLPCLKNHWHAVVSGGIKNVGIGATPGNIYGNSKEDPVRINKIPHDGIKAHYWIHDYFMARPVDFVIMDGLMGIQNGPTPSASVSGTSDIRQDQMNMRLILAGKDAVALDTIESLVMGWDPRTVEYLKLLNKDGYGNMDTAYIDVKGKRVDDVRKRFKGSSKSFTYGGNQFEDYEAPEVKIMNIKTDSGSLSIECEARADTSKIEITLDGLQEVHTITADFGLITIPLQDGAKPASLSLRSYDYVLNSWSTTVDTSMGRKGDYTAFEAKQAPLIDGKGDDKCWQRASWHPIDELWLGSAPQKEDFSGRYKLSWTENRLYVLAEIIDDVLKDTHPDPLDQYYNDDCLEVFIDADASGGDHKTSYNAFAYHVSLSGDVVDLDATGAPRLFNDHADVKVTRSGTTSVWEIGIDVYTSAFVYGRNNEKALLSAGKKSGYAIAYCDSDTGGSREHFTGSVPVRGSDKNVAWMDASVFGALFYASGE